MSNNVRHTWADVAKVGSIGIVTYYHTTTVHAGLSGELQHMLMIPAFFGVAGLLCDDRKYPTLRAWIGHRARQLLLPYLCFELLFIALTDHSWDQLRYDLTNALLGRPTTCLPLWFVVCLMGIQTVHCLCSRLLDRLCGGDASGRRKWLLAAYGVAAACLSPLDLTDIGQLNSLVINLPFYAAGNCCKDWAQQASWRQRPVLTSAMLAGGLALMGLKLTVLAADSPWTAGTMRYAAHLGAGLCMMWVYAATCRAISRWCGTWSTVRLLSSNTLIILAVHTYMIKVMAVASEALWGHSVFEVSPLLSALLSALIVAAHIPVIAVIGRWMPWLSGRAHRTGGQ